MCSNLGNATLVDVIYQSYLRTNSKQIIFGENSDKMTIEMPLLRGWHQQNVLRKGTSLIKILKQYRSFLLETLQLILTFFSQSTSPALPVKFLLNFFNEIQLKCPFCVDGIH